MKHCVAVGADWHKIVDGVDAVTPTHRCNGYDVVNVDKTRAQIPVLVAEVKAAYGAHGAVVGDAFGTGVTVALVAVHEHADGRSFKV